MQITWDVNTAFNISDDSIFPLLAAGGNGVMDVVLDPAVQSDRKVKMIPIQLHWHVTSEHAWDGMLVRFIPYSMCARQPSAEPCVTGSPLHGHLRPYFLTTYMY